MCSFDTYSASQVYYPFHFIPCHSLEPLMKTLASDGAAGLNLPELKARIVDWWTVFSDHLRTEEDHVVCMPRKYLPVEVHKQIIRQVWLLFSLREQECLLRIFMHADCCHRDQLS